MKTIKISNLNNPKFSITAQYADSFFSSFMGLMFRKEIQIDQGIVLVEKTESRINTSIHMFFMNFDICVVWLDSNLKVCDIQCAKKWHLAYFPKKTAQYVLELHPSRILDCTIGDQIQFDYEK